MWGSTVGKGGGSGQAALFSIVNAPQLPVSQSSAGPLPNWFCEAVHQGPGAGRIW
jgi:hypothetical protein